jgi:hypothetical protein
LGLQDKCEVDVEHEPMASDTTDAIECIGTFKVAKIWSPAAEIEAAALPSTGPQTLHVHKLIHVPATCTLTACTPQPPQPHLTSQDKILIMQSC